MSTGAVEIILHQQSLLLRLLLVTLDENLSHRLHTQFHLLQSVAIGMGMELLCILRNSSALSPTFPNAADMLLVSVASRDISQFKR